MFLSRLILNARHPRTKSELDRPYEMHRTLCRAWDDRDAARILFRAEQDKPGVVTVTVQSQTEPDWSRLAAPSDYLLRVDGPKQMGLRGIEPGQRLRFRLRCRPTKRIGGREQPGFGKRRGLILKEDIFEWLRRKAADNGFEIVESAFDRAYWRDSKNGTKEEYVGAVVFDGVLVVTDPERFRGAVRDGIGTQKAFGFGLLSIAKP